MSGLLARFRQRTCRHPHRRVWDLHPEPDGGYLLCIYCPKCGRRWEARQNVEEYIRSASSDAEMADTLRRNLNLGAGDTDGENDPQRPSSAG